MKAGADFQSAKPSLARLMCNVCHEETIHSHSACIHCGTRHVAYPVKNIAMLLRTKARLS
jgi:hypothetical protein